MSAGALHTGRAAPLAASSSRASPLRFDRSSCLTHVTRGLWFPIWEQQLSLSARPAGTWLPVPRKVVGLARTAARLRTLIELHRGDRSARDSALMLEHDRQGVHRRIVSLWVQTAARGGISYVDEGLGVEIHVSASAGGFISAVCA